MRRLLLTGLIVLATLPGLPAVAQAQSAPSAAEVHQLNYDQVVALARDLMANGRVAEAREVLATLRDTSGASQELLFQQGQAAFAAGDLPTAVTHYRQMLDRDPELPRVRLELARTFFEMAEWDLSEFHFRLVLGGDLPEEVRANIYRFLAEIRERRQWRFSADVAIAPNTNINVGPETENVVIRDIFTGAPVTAQLDDDATAQSGFGLLLSGSVEYRKTIEALSTRKRRLRLRVEGSGYWSNYAGSDFDDIIASVEAGPVIDWGRVQAGLSATASQRWFAEAPYSTAVGVEGDVTVYPSKLYSVGVRAGVSVFDYRNDAFQDGPLYTLDTRGLLNLGPASIASLTLGVSRQDADADDLSYLEARIGVGLYQDLPWGLSISLEPSYARRVYDEQGPFFTTVREDNRFNLSASLIKRDLVFHGFAPFVRYSYTKNESSVDLYDYDRHLGQVGLTRVF